MPNRLGYPFILKSVVVLAAIVSGFYALTRDPALAALNLSQRVSPRIDFNRDIRPILADKCWACHGPDAPNKKIKLRLDSEEGAKADLGRGRRAVVPNHPEQSQLVRRVTAADEAMRMPPPHLVDSGRSLTAREIELLTEWIKQGAEWQKHWSFIAAIRPRLPQIKNRDWPKNAIDYFVQERLEKEGLQPSPEADRATLIRRVSFDLTGLPPTAREVDDFLKDKSPKAYEKVVDRLLASPRYGERMAVRWLDAARYADTNGYQIDGERSMWRWRDWVIEAFNRNLPFDQFVIEQLAGDLLPNPTFEQKIATAFNRNHRTNAEDGLVPEEYAVEYVVDRVDTTSTVFMGLTMGCARCHNHKYDPFTQKEYYQLYAYFNSIPEDGRASNYGNSPPWLSAPTREQRARYDKLQNGIAKTGKRLALLARNNRLLQRRWERSLGRSLNTHWFPSDGLLLHHAFDDGAGLKVTDSVARINPAKPDEDQPEKKDEKKVEIGFKNGSPKYVAAPVGQGVEFNGAIFFDAGKTADFNFRDRLKDYKDVFTISAWFYPESEAAGAIVTHMQDTAGEKDNNLPKNKGYGVFFINGKVHFNIVSVWADDSFRVETENKLPVKQWYHVIAAFDSTQPYERAQIYINGVKQKLKINNGRLFRTFGDSNANLRIGGGAGPDYRFKGAIDDVLIYKSLPDDDQVAILSCPDSLEKIAAIPPSKRTKGQRLKILNAWLDSAAPVSLQQTWKKLRELKQQKPKLEAEFPTLMVMQETPEPRPAYLLRRGAYDAPGAKVDRAVPAAMPPMPPDFPGNRLGLAKWLVSREHPLTARVTVNRFWQMLFGVGLVKTSDDFGSQGELPSHPELLDWLAVEFMNGRGKGTRGQGDRENPQSAIRNPQSKGWNIKALLKTIVMSATYRQSSRLTPQLLQRDPENRLLARGPRVRLSAEMIRDQALFVSGLLVEKLGGPSVRPYQPDGLYKDMTFSNMTAYNQDKGDGLWRRSLYTFWKRTVMPPAMSVFDASAREYCTVRETRTNTPLQALNMMNDVTYVEAARMLAARMIAEGGARPEGRVAWAFRLVTSRQSDEKELRVLLKNFNAQLKYFGGDPKEAAVLLAVGVRQMDQRLNAAELAAYAATASLILNLDEVITKQ
ncbi:MAG: DUF1553 domain-containing protein [Blastocatellales bacterium]